MKARVGGKYSLKNKVLTATICMAMLLVFVSCTSLASYPSQADAWSEIQSAEGKLLECYEAVYAAEKAGADVTDLLEVLNRAGWLLSKAKLAYINENFELAYEYALNCSDKLEGIATQAALLKFEAEQTQRMDFLINCVGSAAGSVIILVGGYMVWLSLKRRKAIKRCFNLKISEHWLLYWTIVGVSALLVASPLLNRVLVYPRTEFFTELWILDANRNAENYSFNITRNQNYTLYLGIGNHLGYCTYYLVQVKFLNWSQKELMPTCFGPIEKRLPSSLPSLFNFTVFVADEQVYEIPVTFSFNYTWSQPPSKVELSSLRFNDVLVDMNGYTIFWNATRQEFRCFLFFELWLYNRSVNAFQYHGRFVGLWFNMTVS